MADAQATAQMSWWKKHGILMPASILIFLLMLPEAVTETARRITGSSVERLVHEAVKFDQFQDLSDRMATTNAETTVPKPDVLLATRIHQWDQNYLYCVRWADGAQAFTGRAVVKDDTFRHLLEERNAQFDEICAAQASKHARAK